MHTHKHTRMLYCISAHTPRIHRTHLQHEQAHFEHLPLPCLQMQH